MKRLGLVKASSLEPFVRFLAANGINVDPHLANASIPSGMIREPDSWITKQQVYGFLTDVVSAYDMEALGLVVGDQICVADLGELGKALYRSATLREACACFNTLLPKFAEGNTGKLETKDGQTWFYYQTTDHAKGNRDYADHYGMMMLLSIVRLVAGHWYPSEVIIQTAPCEAFALHPAWKDTRVTFNAEGSGFAFPSAWLTRPIESPPEITPADPENYMGNPPESLSASLTIILNAYLHIGGMPSLERLADSLNMSPRTLKRRLADEGETYSSLIDRVRIQGAKTFLQDTTKPVKEIAYILGYSGSNNFIRAFKRLAGCTPEEWRNHEIHERSRKEE